MDAALTPNEAARRLACGVSIEARTDTARFSITKLPLIETFGLPMYRVKDEAGRGKVYKLFKSDLIEWLSELELVGPTRTAA